MRGVHVFGDGQIRKSRIEELVLGRHDPSSCASCQGLSPEQRLSQGSSWAFFWLLYAHGLINTEHVSLFLTDADHVPRLVSRLRPLVRNVLVGCIGQDNWMVPALQFIVSTPGDAIDMLDRAYLSCLEVETVVLDEQATLSATEVHRLCKMIRHDAVYLPGVLSSIPQDHQKYVPPAGSNLRLPEALTSPELGSPEFRKSIDLFLDGRSLLHEDLAVILAFFLSILRLGNRTQQQCEAVILTPTEKMEVVTEFMLSLGKRLDACPSVTALDQWTSGTSVQVAISTPAILQEHLDDDRLDVRAVKWLIVIDADKLISAFREEIWTIVKSLPKCVQLGIHSDSVTCGVEDLISRLPGPVLRLPKPVYTMEEVSQFRIDAQGQEGKLEAVCDLCEKFEVNFKLISVFCNTPERVEWLAERLATQDLSVCYTHSNMDGSTVDDVNRRYRRGRYSVLVTNVDARQVSPLINFEIPQDPSEYVKRIGKKAPSQDVVVINIVDENDEASLQAIEKLYAVTIPPMPEMHEVVKPPAPIFLTSMPRSTSNPDLTSFARCNVSNCTAS